MSSTRAVWHPMRASHFVSGQSSQHRGRRDYLSYRAYSCRSSYSVQATTSQRWQEHAQYLSCPSRLARTHFASEANIYRCAVAKSSPTAPRALSPGSQLCLDECRRRLLTVLRQLADMRRRPQQNRQSHRNMHRRISVGTGRMVVH